MINLTKYENPITPKPGIYEGVSYEEYDRWNAFRKSLVGPALRSGKHLEHAIKREKKTASLSLGSLVDCLLLEPELFSERYVMQPSTYDKEVTRGRGANKVTEIVTKPWNLNSHTCQSIAKELHDSGKEIVSAATYEKAVMCRDSLLMNDEIKRSVEQSKKQVSIVWNEPNTGVLCKGRLDLYGKTIDDLKTSADASQDAFSQAAGKFLYHVQAAAYQDAIEVLTGQRLKFRFFVVETGEDILTPETAIYEFASREIESESGDIFEVPDNESILAGRLMFKRACEKIVFYGQRGFVGYSQFSEPFSVPQYVINRELAMHEEIEI